VDYKILEGLPSNNNQGVVRYVYPAMALLYLDTEKDLKPIAIQLGQNPGPETPIFIPNDQQDDWMLAKMHLKCADAQVYYLVTYLLYTQKILEPIYIALQRNMAPNHPVYKLLYPYLKSTISTSNRAKTYLHNVETVMDTVYSLGGPTKRVLMNKTFSSTSWNQLVFPKDLHHRGVDDSSKLPNYHYRDDGQLVWRETEHFVISMLQDHYPAATVETIKNDPELQSFISESYTHGLKKMSDFPTSFNTLHELVEFITTIIWTSSILRSLLEHSQYDNLAWVPIYPGCMLKPAPVKGITKPEDIFAALPTKEIMLNQINLAYDQSHQSFRIVPLGHFKEKIFSKKQEYYLHDFKDGLTKIIEEIQSRNSKRNHPYTWLSPDKILI